MASDWLVAVLAANRKACLKIDINYHRFYHGIALVTQTPGRECNAMRARRPVVGRLELADLVGDREAIERELRPLGDHGDRIEIRHADSVIGMDVTPREALRQGAASSMSRAIETLACGEADAFVSAGNTAAMVAMATTRLKPSKGVERPAIAALWPALTGPRLAGGQD